MVGNWFSMLCKYTTENLKTKKKRFFFNFFLEIMRVFYFYFSKYLKISLL